MKEKLVDSELKIMEVLWEEGDVTAKHISDVLKERVGWNINTTYTLIKRCINKGAIQRTEPKFMCHALMFDGDMDQLFASLLGRKRLTKDQIEALRAMVDQIED